MASSRVYPGTSSSGIDMGITSVGYKGGTVSMITADDIETQKNRMTLEDARWIGVRKKVPGMEGIPKKTKSTWYDHSPMVDRYQQDLDNLRSFVRQHFRQKECASFVPKPGQTTGPKAVKKIRDLKCHCGEVLMEHAGMQGPFNSLATADMMTEYLVPKELQSLMSRDRRNEAPPLKLPQVTWKSDSIRKTATLAYGKINFENVEHAGGKKPAKYIRMCNDDSIDNLIELMVKHWKIEQPEKPNLVISVVGGAKNFKLDGRMRDTFSIGLIKAAKTTSAWLISSGFNMGIMKGVGQAVRQGQSFCWDNDRMAHVLRCIGIAPWGYVKNRKALESFDGNGKFNANYRTSNVILHDSAVPLNPDHTHFIFVDDGYRIRYGGVAEVRSKLEQKISQPLAEGGLGIPVVLVVVEGGVDCINDAKSSLEHKIPVVVCAGTGRAADILAYAYTHTKTSGNTRKMKERHELKLMDKIFDAYGKSWKEEEIETKTMDIKDKVQFCCQNTNLMIVFNMNKHEDLDLAILSVLLKSKSGVDEAQRCSQLKLALMWDRSDIAQEEIFREDVLWSTGSLGGVLTEALIMDRVKFVELILQQGIVMKEYLTVETLQTLYEQVPKHNYIYGILHKLVGKDHLTLENVRLLLIKLLDKYDMNEGHYLEIVEENTDSGYRDGKATRFKRPYKMLLVWALLLKRQTLAKLFWELGEEPITSALAATKIYHAICRHLPIHETQLKDTLTVYEEEFEQLATQVLDESHHHDQEKAMMVIERKSPCWNEMTCLQIASAATDIKFLSASSCQDSMNVTWNHGIAFSLPKLMLSILFPPYIAYALEIKKLGDQKLNGWQKLAMFYTTPLSKFVHSVLLYVIFLALHSYMVLVDFDPSGVKPLESFVVFWIFTFFIDEIYTSNFNALLGVNGLKTNTNILTHLSNVFLVFPAPTVKAKLRDWYNVLKWMDLVNYVSVFFGFFVHLFGKSGTSEATKIIYCLNSVLFFLRIIQFYVYHGRLGPKVFMIQKMLDELRMFFAVLFIFLLAYGVASQGLLYRERSPTWVILKDILYYPYWQLYGEIFLDEIKTDDGCSAFSLDCRTYHWLVEILLAMYLLVGNILLLNLLIAIFSQVFQTVNQNAKEIWKYQMYFLVMEYEVKTAIVPPFSIFQHLFLICRCIFRNTCCPQMKSQQIFGRRHLEYLQLFEKEMMMNVLRKIKAQAMSSLEMTVSKLQKRVDDLTKLIEDEVIADQQPSHLMYGMENLDVTMPPPSAGGDGLLQTRWPAVQRVIGLGLREAILPKVVAIPKEPSSHKLSTVAEEGGVKEEEGERKKKKKHKKHKKHKKAEEKEELIEKDKKKEMPERTKEYEEQPQPLFQPLIEHKINNFDLGYNIPGGAEKPDPVSKIIHQNEAAGRDDFSAIRTVSFAQEDSCTDNTTPVPVRRKTDSDSPKSTPRSSTGWTPHRIVRDDSDYNFRKRLSHERMQRYDSDLSESDDAMSSRRFSSQLKQKKKREKKKKRRSYMSDSD